MSKEEAKRRIEIAFASGDISLCRCDTCLTESPVDTYRVPWEDDIITVYCRECADEYGLIDNE